MYPEIEVTEIVDPETARKFHLVDAKHAELCKALILAGLINLLIREAKTGACAYAYHADAKVYCVFPQGFSYIAEYLERSGLPRMYRSADWVSEQALELGLSVSRQCNGGRGNEGCRIYLDDDPESYGVPALAFDAGLFPAEVLPPEQKLSVLDGRRKKRRKR